MSDANELIVSGVEVRKCEGHCGKITTCQRIGPNQLWACSDCIKKALRSIAEYEDEKYRRENLKILARQALDEAIQLNGAGDRNQRLKTKARFRAYKAIKRKLYG